MKIIELLNNKFHGLSPSGGFASLLFDQAVPKNSQRHLADRNAICILHRSDCTWLCCLLSQFWLFGDQKHCVFKPITWYPKSRTTKSIPGLYYWDRLLLWSQLRTGDRVGSVQLALTALSEWKKEKNKGWNWAFWFLSDSEVLHIHKLAVIFSLIRNTTLKGNDLIFNSVVRIWFIRDWRKEYSMKFWIIIYSVIFTFELVY